MELFTTIVYYSLLFEAIFVSWDPQNYTVIQSWTRLCTRDFLADTRDKKVANICSKLSNNFAI